MITGRTLTAVAGLLVAAMTLTANADAISIVDVFGHNEKSNYSGIIADMINGSGMNGYDQSGNVGWPTGEGDPSTWTRTGGGYQQEWQSQDLLGAQTPAEDLRHDGTAMADGEGATNGKIGWAVFDIGSAMPLDKLYIWDITENASRPATSFNVLVAASPTDAVPHGPTGNNSRDYDFASGGWTTVASGVVGSQNGTHTVDLSGNTGRYIALEILSNGGDANRTGFAEVGITVVPEPASLALLGLGGLLIIRRRG